MNDNFCDTIEQATAFIRGMIDYLDESKPSDNILHAKAFLAWLDERIALRKRMDDLIAINILHIESLMNYIGGIDALNLIMKQLKEKS